MARRTHRQNKVKRSVKARERVTDKEIDGKSAKKTSPQLTDAQRRLKRDYGVRHPDGSYISFKLMGVHAMHKALEGEKLTVAELAKKLAKYGITEGQINAQAKHELGVDRKTQRWVKDKRGKLSVNPEAPKPNWRTANFDGSQKAAAVEAEE